MLNRGTCFTGLSLPEDLVLFALNAAGLLNLAPLFNNVI